MHLQSKKIAQEAGIGLALHSSQFEGFAVDKCGLSKQRMLSSDGMQLEQKEYSPRGCLGLVHVVNTFGHMVKNSRLGYGALALLCAFSLTLPWMSSVCWAGDGDETIEKAAYNEGSFHADMARALHLAEKFCRQSGQKQIKPLHVYLALVHLAATQPESATASIVQGLNLSRAYDRHEELQKQILPDGPALPAHQDIVYSEELRKVLAGAEREREARKIDGKESRVTAGHFLLAALHDENTDAAKFLKSMSINPSNVILSSGLRELDRDVKESSRSMLEDYTIDMSKQAAEGKFDPLVGRSEELRRMRVILSQRRQNSPLLVGGAGVGKTALVEELAKTHHVVELKLAFLTAGSKLRGSLEDRIKGIVKELVERNAKARAGEGKPVILFIDEVHLLGEEEYKQVAQHLKPALARGEIPFVAATTLDEQKNVEKDEALNSRFQRVRINEPDRKMTFFILKKVIHLYEKLYGVKYSDRALMAAVDLTNQYVYSENQPRKAIKAIDNAGARAADTRTTLDLGELPPPLVKAMENVEVSESFRGVALEKMQEGVPGAEREYAENEKMLQDARDRLDKMQDLWSKGVGLYEQLEQVKAKTHPRLQSVSAEDLRNEITRELRAINRELPEFPLDVEEEDIQRSVLEMVAMDLPGVMETPEEQLKKLNERVKERFVGQPEGARAIQDAASALITGKSGQGRPAEVHLYIGAHGSGKSLAPSVIQEVALGRKELIKTFNLASYAESNAVNRLIGSPPGFEGGEGRLTEYARRNPRSLIVFKNIDKASPEVLAVIMQVLATGELEDQKTGKVISFESTVIILQTSEGSEFTLDEKLSPEERKAKILEHLQSGAIARKNNQPFQLSADDLSLVDKVVYFDRLTFDELKVIFERELKKLGDERRRNNRFDVKITEQAMKKFEEELKQAEGSVENARYVRQMIRMNIESNQSQIARENLNAAGNLVVDYDAKTDQLIFRTHEMQAQYETAGGSQSADPCAKSFSLLSAKYQKSQATKTPPAQTSKSDMDDLRDIVGEMRRAGQQAPTQSTGPKLWKPGDPM